MAHDVALMLKYFCFVCLYTTMGIGEKMERLFIIVIIVNPGGGGM